MEEYSYTGQQEALWGGGGSTCLGRKRACGKGTRECGTLGPHPPDGLAERGCLAERGALLKAVEELVARGHHGTAPTEALHAQTTITHGTTPTKVMRW